MVQHHSLTGATGISRLLRLAGSAAALAACGAYAHAATVQLESTVFGQTVKYNQGTVENTTSVSNLGTTEIIGNATLENRAGATLTNSGSLKNVKQFNNAGTFTSSGTVIGQGEYKQPGGQTVLQNGTMAQDSFNFAAGTLSGTGTLIGDVALGVDALLTAGDSVGAMSINGNLVSDGDFIFEIAGSGTAQYDELTVSDAAEFDGGSMLFNFINGFNGAVGTWDVLIAGAVIDSTKLSYSVNGLANGLSWSVVDFGTGLRLQLAAVDAPAPVPLPPAFLLMLSGLGVIGWLAKRRDS